MKLMQVKKAVFVVAGFGTRFLPATKAQPKEMLPIVDQPIIQYLVEEAVKAGIEEVVFVTGRGKNAIENHFDKSYELEEVLKRKGKEDKFEEVSQIAGLANFAYVRQPVQQGDGHALLCAKPFFDPNEPVMVVFPDYLMPPENKSLQKLVDAYNKTGSPVICADMVPKDEVVKYGVLEVDSDDEIMQVTGFVEKPKTPDLAPSNYINAGYFILTPKVLDILETSKSTTEDGEIRIADALVRWTESGKYLYAVKPEQPGYDCGSILGFLKAQVDFGLRRDDLRDDFLEFLKTKIK
jgi:UTP--glucose-1-phosphate uridylyltransferase